MYIHHTLVLEGVYLSETCLPLVVGREDIGVLGNPRLLEFDSDGHIVSPFLS